MKLYNTLTKKVEEFVPQNNNTVSVYTCGPTVYDYPHIGNWFTFVRYDTLIRTLRSSGYKVDWVMNITDVGHLVSDADEGEDKLEKGARREGKTAWEVAAYYGDYFKNGLKRLNFSDISTIPKATQHIQEQIDLIRRLEENGYTYQIDDGIYFNTKKFKDYASFANIDLSEQKAGARVEVNPQKKNPYDFALWKFSPKGQKRDMEWESPWGIGFPGWHIECSAMAMKYLGNTLDIHGGGIDHIPVHHTNEIAQSEAATGKQFSNYWVHSNFILVDGKKMSKSLGNFYTLEDIEQRGFGLMDFRLLILESSYRTESEFSWELLQAAHNRLAGFYELADMQFQTSSSSKKFGKKFFESKSEEIFNAMQNDMNTAIALRVLNDVAAQITSGGLHPSDAQLFVALLETIDTVFGLNISMRKDINTQQKKLLKERQLARDNRDWAQSDQLRDTLEAQGIGVKDTPQGQIWFRA